MDGAKRKKTVTKKKHLIDIISVQDMIMPGVAQSSPALRTVRYYGKFFLSLALSFSLNSTHLIRIIC